MNFSNTHHRGQAIPKIALIVVVHVLLAYGFIMSVRNKTIKLPQVIEDVMLIAPDIPPPPPPPETKPVQKTAPPEALRPPVEVDIPPPVVPLETIQTAELAEIPPAAPTAPAGPPTPVAQPQTGMRTAVLAEGCATPAYPPAAARAGETGTVLLALLIGSDGKVSDARVQKSSGSALLDKAARSALSLCRFKPATADGVATAGWSAISYVWKLD
jgi:protein TonB